MTEPNEPLESAQPVDEPSETAPAHPATLAPETPNTGDSFTRMLIEIAVLVLVAFVLAQGIKTFVVQPYIIPTGSMIPTIKIGDRVLAEKVTYRFRDPKPGEIVVFDDPNGQNPQLIKRVIAVGGQTVDIRDSAVWVDGKRLDETYTHGLPTDLGPGTKTFPMQIPEGYVFLLGDNRPFSGDARYFGPQPISKIRAHAFLTYWPMRDMGMLQETEPGIAKGN